MEASIVCCGSGSSFRLRFGLYKYYEVHLLASGPSGGGSFIRSLTHTISHDHMVVVSNPVFNRRGTVRIISRTLNAMARVTSGGTCGVSDSSRVRVVGKSVPLISGSNYFTNYVVRDKPRAVIILASGGALHGAVVSGLVRPCVARLCGSRAAGSAGPRPSVGPRRSGPVRRALVASSSCCGSCARRDSIMLRRDISLRAPLVLSGARIFRRSAPGVSVGVFVRSRPSSYAAAPVGRHVGRSRVVLRSRSSNSRGFPRRCGQTFSGLFVSSSGSVASRNCLGGPPLRGNCRFLSSSNRIVSGARNIIRDHMSRVSILAVVVSMVLFLTLVMVYCYVFSIAAGGDVSPGRCVRGV